MVLYARKAVSLDPMDADAHAALGYALTLTGDSKQGEARLDEALRLTPNAFDVLIFHACLDQSYGKAEKGGGGCRPRHRHKSRLSQMGSPLPPARRRPGRTL